MTRGRHANARRLLTAPSEQNWADESADDRFEENSRVAESGRASCGLLAISKKIVRLVWGALVVVGCAVGVTWGVYRYTTTSPRFAVKDIQISGAVRTTHDSLVKLSGVTLGDNLFKLNLGVTENRLLKDPWIRGVKVSRQLPATLHVDIDEREATAVAVLDGHLLLVTRQGETFKELANEDPNDLPTITGVTVDDTPRDLSLEKQRIGVALDVLNHYAQVKLSRTYPAEEVHLTPGGEVVLTVGHKGIALYLGFGPWSKKLALAERIFSKLQAQRSTPSLVFLDNRAHPERVVVRVN